MQLAYIEDRVEVERGSPCLRWKWGDARSLVLGRAGPSMAHFLHVTEDLLEVGAQEIRSQYLVIRQVKSLRTKDVE